MTKRKAITPAMKIDCVIYRGLLRCGICNDFILYGHRIEWDHIQALIHGGGHDFTNIRPLHEECHKIKTKADIAANAKVKRIIANKPSRRPMKSSGRKMQSRPFQKRPKADICGCDACQEPGVPPHLSSCAVHREPAEPNGLCDCRS